jgi:serine/threonine-protein kinase
VVPFKEVAPTVVLGEYVVRRNMRQSQFGSLYLGEHLGDGKQVLLTVIEPDLAHDADFRARLAGVASEVRTLSHPSLMRLLDFSAQDDTMFLTTEYAVGESLRDLARRGQPMAGEDVTSIGAAIGSCLDYLWSQGKLRHGNVKPSNIILPADNTVSAKLQGLTVARLVQLLQGDSVHGTPYYLCPELLLREPLDARSEMYSLGTTLYHAACAVPPFAGGSPEEIARRRLEQQATPLHQVNGEISPGLSSVIARMMALRPQDRYQNFSLLLADLHLVAEGEQPLTATL